MTCQHLSVPGGAAAIVYSPTRRCKCGARATRLCDWKMPAKASGTCDKPLCTRCATSPAADKDLCADHAVAWRAWRAGR
jgi:hypothetical protein